MSGSQYVCARTLAVPHTCSPFTFASTTAKLRNKSAYKTLRRHFINAECQVAVVTTKWSNKNEIDRRNDSRRSMSWMCVVRMLVRTGPTRLSSFRFSRNISHSHTIANENNDVCQCPFCLCRNIWLIRRHMVCACVYVQMRCYNRCTEQWQLSMSSKFIDFTRNVDVRRDCFFLYTLPLSMRLVHTVLWIAVNN